MGCEVLASVMDQKNSDFVVKRLGIDKRSRCLIVNQIVKRLLPKSDIVKGNHRFLSFNEKGLSRSRNRAIDNSVGDICLIADDDMKYVDDYEQKVLAAYKKYPDADIIAFIVDRENKVFSPKIKKEGRVSALMTMKLSSVQLTFRRKSIVDKNIRFDEEFGAGSKYPWGEENIFLFDCIRKGCKVYYAPVKIATLLDLDKSSWDKSNTSKHYKQQGAIYYRMSPKLWWVLALQFVIRKRKIYRMDMSGLDVFRAMVVGTKEYKLEHRDD